MSRYHLRTLGHLSLHDGGSEGEVVLSDAKALAVLAYLATTPEGRGNRSHLAQLLWPGKDPARARAGLRQALYYLRQKTAGDVELVRTDGDRLALDPRHLDVDLWEFEEALAAEDWERVLDLHGGPFLADYSVVGGQEFRNWRQSRDDGIRAGVREACRALVTEGFEEDEHGRALRGARLWVELNPLDEEGQAALIRSLVAIGDRGGAFRAYESYRSLLAEELGESPGPRLAGVLEELRSMTEGPAPADGEATAIRGLRRPGDAGPTAGRRLVWAGLVVGLAVVAGAGWWALGGGGWPGGSGDGSGAVRLLVQAQGGGQGPGSRVLRVRDGGAVSSSPADVTPGGVPSPDGTLMALGVRTDSGPDLAVRDREEGSTRRLAGGPADEVPLGWSPDGRWLLYRAGRLEAGGRYVHRYRLRAVDGRADRSLGLAVGRGRRLLGPWGADWSPLGTAIAATSDSAGNPDVWVVRPDGSGARNLTEDHPGLDADPAWSPAGDRLAFVSDRAGSRDVWVMLADGSRPRRVTWGPARVSSPVWLDHGRLAYVRQGPEGGEVRVADVFGGETAHLVGIADPAELRVMHRPASAGRWIASVELPSHLRRVSPGQWIRRRALVRDASGRALPAAAVALQWSSTDSSVVDPAAGDGWLRVRGPGEAVLTASAGGWRADTLEVRSRELSVRDVPPVLEEDWAAGIDSSRWLPVGEPSSRVVQGGGRFPAALVNGGDENYHSGVLAREALEAHDGFTVEVWGRAPFTRPHYQALAVGLVSGLPGPDAAFRVPGVRLELTLASGAPDSMSVNASGRTARVPAPDSPGAWHRYAVQVDTAGRVGLVVDGRMHWRSPHTVDAGELDGTHLGLYGRSVGTRILHGPVRVYGDVRYRF